MTTSLADLRKGNGNLPAEAAAPPVAIGMDTVQGFEGLQRIAKLFAASDIVPPQYKSLPNAVIAVDMALRMGANPLLTMQNLYVVHNRPAWSAQFLIATFNKSGRYSSISYEFQGKEGTDEWGCRAVTTETATGQRIAGPLVTIELAKAEGWYSKAGSKWKTMPELMLRYRSATFLVRTVAPEIAMGLHTVEEVSETYDLEPAANGKYEMTSAEIVPAPPAPEKPKGKGKAAPAAEKTVVAEPAPAPAPAQEPEPAPAPTPEPAADAADAETYVLHGKILERNAAVYLYEAIGPDNKGYLTEIDRDQIRAETETTLTVSLAYAKTLKPVNRRQQ
jgi:hypothetical protein